MLTEVTALTATDVAGDIHLCRWLREGEVRRAETNLRVGAEHFLSEVQQYLLEVSERYVLVYIESLQLMEEAMCAVGDGLVAIHATWADDADGRL